MIKRTTLVNIVNISKEHEAMKYTIIIAHVSLEPYQLYFLKTYSACIIQEAFIII